MGEEKNIYRYDDNICFRKCSLSNDSNREFGDCTKFYIQKKLVGFFNYVDFFYCNQHGFHFYCNEHRSIELEKIEENDKIFLRCPKCNKKTEINSYNELYRKCQEKLNIKDLSDAKYIRLDDWYITEKKEKIDIGSDYWMSVDVKKDKEKDTIIIIYVGNKNSTDKVQYFIKPEKKQLAHDLKDLDPNTIISKIEVTLNDRIIKEEYDNN